MTGDDTDDILKIRSGDAQVFDMLVESLYRDLVRFALTYVQSVDVAEDIVQGVFCHLWEVRERWAPKSGVRAYLFAAVRNRALDLMKHERVAATHRYLTLLESKDSVEEAEVREEDQELLLLIAELTERQQTALRLRYEEQCTIREIAGTLDVSERAVERLLERALGVLRSRLCQ